MKPPAPFTQSHAELQKERTNIRKSNIEVKMYRREQQRLKKNPTPDKWSPVAITPGDERYRSAWLNQRTTEIAKLKIREAIFAGFFQNKLLSIKDKARYSAFYKALLNGQDILIATDEAKQLKWDEAF